MLTWQEKETFRLRTLWLLKILQVKKSQIDSKHRKTIQFSVGMEYLKENATFLLGRFLVCTHLRSCLFIYSLTTLELQMICRFPWWIVIVLRAGRLSEKWDVFWKLILKKVFFTSYILELLIFIFSPSFTCSIYISMSYSPILYMKYITKVVSIRKYLTFVLPYFNNI